MTDKIVFGKGVGPIGGINSSRKTGASKAESGKAPADRVDFSSVLQDVSKTKEAGAARDPERAQRIASLKSQIASGSYRPDLEKVAGSLLNFLAEEK